MKKKSFELIIVVTLFLVFCAGLSHAATITVGTDSASPGAQNVILPVNLVSGTGEDVSGLNMDIGYDTSKVTFKGVTTGQAALDAGKTVSSSSPQSGTIRIIVFGLNQTRIADGIIANISFDIQSGISGAITLTVSKAAASAPDATSVPLSTVAGSITISSAQLEDIRVYPNPCKRGQKVNIKNLPLNEETTIYIYNIAGEIVRTLKEGEEIEIGLGSETAVWDTKNEDGEAVASGIYPYLIKSNQSGKSGKIVLVK